MPRRVRLDDRELAAFQTVFAFLRSRLGERESIDWALRLPPGEQIKRSAVLSAIDREVPTIAEPWRSAWRLIEESWASGTVDENDSTDVYPTKRRLQQGDRSGGLIRAITELVAPRLKVEVRAPASKRPRTIHDLLSVRLTSGTHVDPHALSIEAVTEQDFLVSLARSLEASISHGLESARRIGWDGKGFPWQIGSLRRAYYVSGGGEQDPDKYHRGIAPSVKLLHEVVSRLGALQPPLAREFARQWKATDSPIHLRLWAALARNTALVDAEDVARALLGLKDEQFWDLHYYPELTELRARRFGDLDTPSQTALTARIRKLPPRRLWRRKIPRHDLAIVRLGRAIEELRRIQSGCGTIAQRDVDWLAANKAAFPDIPETVPADYGFTPGSYARLVPPNPERSYDGLSGEERLKALEEALSTTNRRWNDDPAQRALDWLREDNNAFKVVADLEPLENAGAAFPHVWNILGTVHVHPHEQNAAGRNLPDEAQRMFSLLRRLPDDVVRQAIRGIALWLMQWESHFAPAMADLWLRLWSAAMDSTNKEVRQDETQPSAAVTAQAEEHQMQAETDTLNTPAGQLVGVFLSVLPPFPPGERPFDASANLRDMRDAVLQSTGRARLISLHRMIEDLSYFLLADPEWAKKNLVEALNANDQQAIALWHAIARETRFYAVLKPIGEAMAQRASDPALSRETRQSLTFSLVVESLHALNEARAPAIPQHRVQQMLRSVDDEVRVHAAYAVQRFIEEASGDKQTAEDLFGRAVGPFLRDVWPQERSLVTPGVSAAFANIPAAAVGVFAIAVASIERFLVPFQCWGMYEYGLDDIDGARSRLAMIDTYEKAAALLRLLDLTIGSSEGSVVPGDLSHALQRVREVAPTLVDGRVFQRLTAAARRA